MEQKKLGMLWAIICIASVILMFIVQSTTGWELSYVIPMIGVLICFIITFVFKKDE